MTVAKPQDFKLTRFYVETEEESIAVQKAMFKMGFRWVSSKTGTVRKTVNGMRRNWILVDHECHMYYTSGNFGFKIDGMETKAASQAALIAAADAFHKQKTQKRKESRMRKKGWIINTGVKPEGVVEAIKFRNNKVRTAADLGVGLGSDLGIPYSPNPDYTVVAYKLKADEPKKEAVTFGEMVKDIVESAKTPTLPEGFVAFTPTKNSVCPVKAGVEVEYILKRNADKGTICGPVVGSYLRWKTFTDTAEVWATDIVAYRVVSSKVIEKVADVETNPKKQFGDKSIPLNLWPALASSYGALGLYNGKLKYGQSNFVATPVEASIYIAGAMRHLQAWAEGEEFDPADGVPNLGGVLANIAILLEARATGTLIDDRKLGSGYLKEREELKKIVASLQVLHADKSPRHYTLKDAK